MNRPNRTTDFFFTDGTLRSNNPSYVQRPADEALAELATQGKFCYVLASRQMGKSSLMTRTDLRLKKEGVHTVKIDLTQMGTTDVTADQWYLGLITWIHRKLRLSIDLEKWWLEQAALSIVQRFIIFLRDVLLTEVDGHIVIFIDEIDTTLKLNFSDDFFAAIRAAYNARTEDPNFSRLTFVLLGVATPSDLIKDPARTPFNVGEGIDLREFSRENAQVLQTGLDQAHPGQGKAILDRVFYWTNGHPYLTQKLCQSVVRVNNGIWSDDHIDGLVQELFLSEKGRQEANLQFIRTNLIQHPARSKLLGLYRQVYSGKKIYEDKGSLEQNYLKLFGLVRAEKGFLEVRNNIYRRAFDQDWIKANIPTNLYRSYAFIATAVIVVLLLALGLFIWRQGTSTNEALVETFIDGFAINNPTLRLNNLAKLFELKADEQARALFFALSDQEQRAVFEAAAPDLHLQTVLAIKGVYTTLENNERDTKLLTAMHAALSQLEAPGETANNLRDEIEQWLAGRTAIGIEQNYDDALVAYSTAIGKNSKNPATYFERGLVFTAREGYQDAIDDFAESLSLRETLEIENNAPIYLARAQAYRAVGAYDEAVLDFATALSLSNDPEIHFERALLYIDMGQQGDALTEFKIVLELDPDWLPQVQQAFNEIGQLEDALHQERETRPTLVAFVAAPTLTPTPTPSQTPTPSATPTLVDTPTLIPQNTLSPTLPPPPSPTARGTSTATATPPQPVPTLSPAPPSDIVIFVQSNFQYHNIGVVTASGEMLNTTLQNQASAPTWCNISQEIVFFSEPGVNALDNGIWLAQFRDSRLHDEKRLINIDHVQNMVCSPKGDKLAFEILLNPSQPEEQWEFQVQVIYASLTRPELVIDKFSGRQPAWLNNQQLVVNTCEGGGCGLFLVNCIGNSCDYPGKVQLTENSSDSYPTSSPNNEAIAFSRKIGEEWDIFLRDKEGIIRNLTKDLGGTNTTPIFSPDGQYIYFRTDTRGRGYHWDIMALHLASEGGGTSEIIPDPIIRGIGPSDNAGLARPAIFNLP